jgi:penicillin-binding protein 1A
MNEGVAWIMQEVLKSVVSHNKYMSVSDVEPGGKTGTTNDQYDIWFDGFTPTYAASIWIGTDENVEMSSMSTPAAALWGRIMGKVDRADDGEYKGMPHNITLRDGEFYTDGTEPPVKKKEENYHSSTTEPETKTVSPEELARKAAEAAQQAAQQAGGQ